MPDIRLDTLTASAAARAIREGRLSAEALLDACLARIARFNPTLNALVTVDAAGAREAAKAADRQLAAGGPVPPLLGVPVSIKDAFATRGLRTTASFRPLADYLPGEAFGSYFTPCSPRLRVTAPRGDADRAAGAQGDAEVGIPESDAVEGAAETAGVGREPGSVAVVADRAA